MSQNNAKQQIVSKSAKRRQRQRKRAAAQGAVAPQKSVQSSRQSNQVPRNRPKGNRRGRGRGLGPLGTDWPTRTRTLGGVFQTTDPFGSGWEEKSGMLGVGNTRGMRQSRRDMVIEESEFIGAVTVANQPNFNVAGYPINPGQSAMFPWLSTIAKNFERYHFEALSFVFKKEVSEFNAAGAAGKIIMSVDFDAADAPPATKQQMEDTIPHADAMPCQSFSLPINPLDLSAQNTLGRYVRTGGLPGSTDIKTYDVGNLFVATQGVPSNVEIGELHVAYRVRLIKPVLENNAGAPANNQVSQFLNTAGTNAPSTVQSVVHFADTTVAAGFANGLNIANVNGVFTPPPGNYLLDYQLVSANTGNGTVFSSIVQKNGGLYPGGAGDQPTFTLPSAAYASWCVPSTMFISANGTDTYSIIATNTFSTGTSTVFGWARWTAV